MISFGQIDSLFSGVLEVVRDDLSTVKTGRAKPDLVANLQIAVQSYGSTLKLLELANISAPDSQTLLISPWDKSILTNIVGGITKANVGLNAVVDGDIIRIVIPPLTSERREQFIKQMHGILEKFRVEVRQIRHQYLESVKTDRQSGRISEDDEEREKHEIQKLHDEYIEAIEVAGKIKEEQLREV